MNIVLPLAESTYPLKTDRAARCLLGFSKSGWGALSLLLRHGEHFGGAAAWDAPLDSTAPDRWGMAEVFGTQENFNTHAVFPLLRQKASRLQSQTPRIVIAGYGNFQASIEKAHNVLQNLSIAHAYLPSPQREHRWDSGWMEDTTDALYAISGRQER